MKFSSTSLTLLLLPLLSLASPVALTPKDVSETSEDALFKRKVEYCQIVNVSSTVNCRAGPGTGLMWSWVARGIMRSIISVILMDIILRVNALLLTLAPAKLIMREGRRAAIGKAIGLWKGTLFCIYGNM
ncbi:hypothetical protein V490_06114 [Pseudogymnoascus sp. VKM F-3557]|nr:hypothetical protein V490_06114 [Pseudogymnoascus sp. VKM F-3557]